MVTSSRTQTVQVQGVRFHKVFGPQEVVSKNQYGVYVLAAVQVVFRVVLNHGQVACVAANEPVFALAAEEVIGAGTSE